MSEKSHYPPEYWKLEKEMMLADREIVLADQIISLFNRRIDLNKERIAIRLNKEMSQDESLQITRKGECKLIQFVPVREN